LVGEEKEGIIIWKGSQQGIYSRESETISNNNWKEDEVTGNEVLEEASVGEQSAERRKELTCAWRTF